MKLIFIKFIAVSLYYFSSHFINNISEGISWVQQLCVYSTTTS